MKALSRLGLVIAPLMLLCVVGMRADDHFVDYDTSVDFTTFRTFSLGTGTMNSTAPELNNAITRKGIADTIRAMLAKRKLIERAPGDVVVNWQMGAEPTRGSRPIRAGRPRREPFTYTKGTIVIELTHGPTLVWHGTYRDDEDNPAKIAERLPRNIAKLLGDFPPRK